MFVSLNKKILYSILLFLCLLIALFYVIFINWYGRSLQNQQNLLYLRNQYVVELLNSNISLQRELNFIIDNHPEIKSISNTQSSKHLAATQKELSREQKLNAELKKNYDTNKEAMRIGTQIIGFSFIIVILFVVLLLIILNAWIIRPIEKLIAISNKVSLGIFSSRIKADKRRFNDEFDILYDTFNKMLDNMEYNIKETKTREHFLQKLIDTIPDGIRVIDKDYNVIMANKAFHTMFKQNRSCIGKKCHSIYGFECEGCPQGQYACPVKELLYNDSFASDDFHTIHEVRHKPLYLNASRLRWGQSENDIYIVETFHDLSGDVRFSHQQKVSSLGFLSTSIAHEMKNNLGAIRMIFEGILSNYYKKVPDSNDQKKYLQMAYSQLVESIKIPERLLRLAQFSENEISDIDVENAIKDMTLMIDYEAKRQGISIQTSLQSGLYINGNEADFKMIILNLTQNAIKAMPDGGELFIESNRKNSNVYINIKDTGIGIGDEQIRHIFEPFYSANNSVKSSGLGLAIVSNLMEKARGRISVKSKVGKGTTFSLRFPIKKK